MKKILFTIIFACSMVSAIAQPSTPLKDSTVGLFSSDMDNVVSVTGWSGINFSKLMVGASYGYVSEGLFNGLPSTTFHSNILNAGGIFEAGPVRVGATYTGALGNGSIFNTKTDETINKTTKDSKEFNDHTAYVLIGLPIGDLNLGVRAGINVSGNRENQGK